MRLGIGCRGRCAFGDVFLVGCSGRFSTGGGTFYDHPGGVRLRSRGFGEPVLRGGLPGRGTVGVVEWFGSMLGGDVMGDGCDAVCGLKEVGASLRRGISWQICLTPLFVLTPLFIFVGYRILKINTMESTE